MKPIHFSDLKHMAASPLHCKHAIDNPMAVTEAMRVGTQVHRIVLDQPQRPVFPGRRTGGDWQLFVIGCGLPSDEILNTKEHGRACDIAEAIYKHPEIVRAREEAQFEVPLEWELLGMKCRTRGIDIQWTTHHDDLKTCRTVNPNRLLWECTQRLYHAQLAWYEIARETIYGFKRTRPHRLFCVESTAPFDHLIVELSDRMLEDGRRACFKWLEQFKVCVDSDYWPGYSAAPIVWEPRVTLDLEEEDMEEEDEEITE